MIGIRKEVCILITLIFLLLAGPPSMVTADDKAPDFLLTDTDGNNWTLREFEGNKTVLIDLMAIDCDYCARLERNLKAVYPDYKDDVFMITVDVWKNSETEQELRDHKEANNVSWPMAMDTDGLKEKFGAGTIPLIVIIDLDGRIVFEHVGVMSEEELRQELDRAIEEPVPIVDKPDKKGFIPGFGTSIVVAAVVIMTLAQMAYDLRRR
jgi:peroxiredoxin